MSGPLFRTDKQGFLLIDDVEQLYNERVIYKKKMLQPQQEFENTKDEKYKKQISRFNNIQIDLRKISLNSIMDNLLTINGFCYYDKPINA